MARDKVFIPEVIEPDEKLPVDLVALRRFAYLMDEAVAIPGTRRRVGLDAAVGLIPGVGDIIGGAMSAWIIVAALRHRVPARRIARMIVNVLADVTIGAIPILGDVFDFLFEENVMNLESLLRHRDRSRPPRSMRDIAVVAVVIVGGLALIAVSAIVAATVLTIWLIQQR